MNPCDRRRGARRAGFTLVELLVVIAIIAILSAILFPVLTRARQRAQQSACLNNGKQVATAIQLYLGDWGDRFPMTRDYRGDPLEDEDSEEFIETTDLLQPYLRAEGVWRCGADRSPLYVADDDDDGPDEALALRISYAFNDWYEYGPRLSQVRSPAQAIYMAERAEQDGTGEFENARWWSWGRGQGGGAYHVTPEVLEDAAEQIAPTRHGGGANYAYVDGHSRWRRFEETWAPTNEWDPR